VGTMIMNLLSKSSLDFVGSTNVHPLGLTVLILAAVMTCTVRRAYVPVGLLSLAAFIPSAQRIVVAGADFNFVRALVIVALCRIMLRSEWRWIKWNAIDLCVLVGGIARVACYPIVCSSSEQLIAQIGENFALIGAYLMVRCCVRGLVDMRTLVYCAAIISCAAVPFFVLEGATGRNLFSVFGGVSEITNVREGRIRCCGAISHAILAGCFFVAWLPLWIGLMVSSVGRARLLGVIGVVAALVIVVCCASSTPVVALILGSGVWAFFPFRRHLRIVYLAAIATGFALHFVMKMPVWHLISRIDLAGGSTGHHRYRLIDAAIHRFPEWWLLGIKTTAHWGWGLYDVTNQFILDAVHGGVWALLAMIGVFVFGYAAVGRELRRLAALRMAATQKRMWAVLPRIAADEALTFGLGAALCTQMAIFLAVSYFGQTIVIWQFLMALAACMAQWSSPAPMLGRGRAEAKHARTKGLNQLNGVGRMGGISLQGRSGSNDSDSSLRSSR
jgi:hypothetical protein